MVQRDNNFNEKATFGARQNNFKEMLDDPSIQRPSEVTKEDSGEGGNQRT